MNFRLRLVPSSARLIISFALLSTASVLAPGATAAPDQAGPPQAIEAKPGAPIRKQLASGLHLIVVERPGSRMTAIEIQVRFGSGMETGATNGLAHLCEHMVFKGTTTRSAGAIDAAIEGIGGELNARTGRNSTRFSTIVPSENWRKALDVTGDMLQNAAFRDEDLSNERQVIHGEIAWADCEPVRAGYSDLAAALFTADDPDRLPLMGSVENLDKFTPADLTTFFHQYYRPENLTIVVVGDVKADDVLADVNKLFPEPPDRAFGSHKLPKTSRVPGIFHAPTRPQGRLADRSLTTVFVGFPIPMAEARVDLPAIDTLASMIAVADQPRGLLESDLVEKQGLAVSVTAEFVPGVFSGMFVVAATGKPEDAPRLEAAIIAGIGRLRETPAAVEDVESARLSAASSVNGDDTSLVGLAHRLANQDIEGLGQETSDAYADQIGKVTPAAVDKLIDHSLLLTLYGVAVIGPAPVTRASAATGESRKP